MRDYMVGDGHLFQPDMLLPAQFFAHVRKRVPQEAEYRLVVAILQDAIECFQKHVNAPDRKARQLFVDAEAWIAADDRTWPYSFVNVCELLGLDPGNLRAGLQAWKERHAIVRRSNAVTRLHGRTKSGPEQTSEPVARAG
jgi:hypothetical protein